MAEYIEREAVLDCEKRMIAEDGCYHMAVLCGDVRKIPAADVAPVVHARWEEVVEPNTVDTYGILCTHMRCTGCGFRWTNKYAVRMYFKRCPSCGAKMDAK